MLDFKIETFYWVLSLLSYALASYSLGEHAMHLCFYALGSSILFILFGIYERL